MFRYILTTEEEQQLREEHPPSTTQKTSTSPKQSITITHTHPPLLPPSKQSHVHTFLYTLAGLKGSEVKQHFCHETAVKGRLRCPWLSTEMEDPGQEPRLHRHLQL